MRGLRKLLRRLWRRYVDGHDEVVVFVNTLSASPLVLATGGVVVRPATDDDVATLASTATDPSTRRIPRLLERGQGWVHVAAHDGRLVGYRCAMRRFTGPRWLSSVVRLEPDQVYVDHIFVDAAYRGHNVAQALSSAQSRDLAALGFRGYLSVIKSSNLPSIRLTLRRGARPSLFVRSRRRLFVHRLRVSPVMPPEIQALVEEVRT